MENNRVWICPNNDLEAKTIIELLEKNGEDYIVTGQAWGASWEMLETEIKAEIEKAKTEGKEIYGIELQGDSKGAINIDHHTYGEDDRSNPKSSIEQVAEVLGVELKLVEQFVAANDKGAIQAMEDLGKELGISGEELKWFIVYVRRREREVQGITMEQEVQAQEAIEKLGDLSNGREYVLVEGLAHSKTATITDRLYEYGIYGKNGNVLITSKDGETNFFGSAEIIDMLEAKFRVEDPETGKSNTWKGGLLKEKGYGYWGDELIADQEAIKEAVEKMIRTNKKNKEEKTIDE